MRLRSPRCGEAGGSLLVLLILAVVLLAVTNPSEETHRKRLAEAIPGFRVGSGIGQFLGTAQVPLQHLPRLLDHDRARH